MRRQRGVTIVEGLVALVILSVGMLGIASLYVTSLKTGRTALLRTQAVNLVNDIMDSIRANGRAGTAYAMTALPTAAPPSDPEDPAPPLCGDDGVCTADQIASQDLMSWADAVRAALPRPEARIVYTDSAAGTPDIYTVSVSWQESGETQQYTYRGSLEMLPVMP
jgi:type IV pilus assembly protein PilV